MKKTVTWKVLSLLLATVIAGYYLFPTLSGRSSLPSLLPLLLPRAERLNLGLDLQGGMHLVLDVVTEKAVENSIDRLVTELRREAEKENIAVERMTREGVDRIRIRLQEKEGLQGLQRILKGRSNLQQSSGTDPAELVLSLASGELKRMQESAVRQSLETIRNRIDQFGVAEPHIVQEGDRRIIVQLPGIKEPQRAINLIGKTALLEFKLVAEEVDPAEAVAGKISESDELLYLRRADEQEKMSKIPLVVRRQAVLTGDLLTSAQVQIDSQTNEPVVSIEFDREGARLFGEATAANVGRRWPLFWMAPSTRRRSSERRLPAVRLRSPEALPRRTPGIWRSYCGPAPFPRLSTLFRI